MLCLVFLLLRFLDLLLFRMDKANDNYTLEKTRVEDLTMNRSYFILEQKIQAKRSVLLYQAMLWSCWSNSEKDSVLRTE